MNNDNFYNGGQPQNNMNPGMSGMQSQNNMNPGMPGVQPQNNMNPGMSGMQSQINMNPGMPGVQPQNNMNPGMVNPYNQYPGVAGVQPKKPINKNLIIGIGAIVGIAIIVIILFATGIIGGKTLTCTKSETTMGMTMKEEMKIKFKDDHANKITSKATIIYGDNSEYKEYMEEAFKEEVEELKEEGINAELKTTDDSLTVTFTLEKDKALDYYYIDEEESTYEEIKESLESSGYTCK
ncbi:MAG: hypothetical protein IJO43_04015 [Bacilli bacterium]|nr:hypothetical protein [Bacilli bacterium]